MTDRDRKNLLFIAVHFLSIIVDNDEWAPILSRIGTRLGEDRTQWCTLLQNETTLLTSLENDILADVLSALEDVQVLSYCFGRLEGKSNQSPMRIGMSKAGFSISGLCTNTQLSGVSSHGKKSGNSVGSSSVPPLSKPPYGKPPPTPPLDSADPKNLPPPIGGGGIWEPAKARARLREGLNLITFAETLQLFYDVQTSRYPNHVKLPDEKKLAKDLQALQQLVVRDKYTEDEVKQAVEFALDDPFWCEQVKSLTGLRRVSSSNGRTKFANIVSAMERADYAGRGSGKDSSAWHSALCSDTHFSKMRDFCKKVIGIPELEKLQDAELATAERSLCEWFQSLPTDDVYDGDGVDRVHTRRDMQRVFWPIAVGVRPSVEDLYCKFIDLLLLYVQTEYKVERFTPRHFTAGWSLHDRFLRHWIGICGFNFVDGGRVR